jgi:DNA-directed RNA polymerase alpha subunit
LTDLLYTELIISILNPNGEGIEMATLWFETDISKRHSIALKFDNIRLQDWGLSTRTLNALLRHNSRMSIADVIRADESITEIQNLGQMCIKELDAKVSEIFAETDENLHAWLSTLQPNSLVPPSLSVSEPLPNVLSLKSIMEELEGATLWYETNASRRNVIAQKFDDVPLRNWGLSNRTLYALLRYDVGMSIGDVIRADKKITKIQNIGSLALEELNSKVGDIN